MHLLNKRETQIYFSAYMSYLINYRTLIKTHILQYITHLIESNKMKKMHNLCVRLVEVSHFFEMEAPNHSLQLLSTRQMNFNSSRKRFFQFTFCLRGSAEVITLRTHVPSCSCRAAYVFCRIECTFSGEV